MAKKPKKKGKARRPLTRREQKLVEHVKSGKSLTAAAPLAGYSDKNPGQSGFQAMENIKKKAPDLFADLGLDDKTFIEKHIIPALNATQTKVALHEGKFKYSKTLVDWGTRARTNELVADMKGLRQKERENTALPGVRVVIINAANRPPAPASIPPKPAAGLGVPNKQETNV
jgi:hypothetical protein